MVCSKMVMNKAKYTFFLNIKTFHLFKNLIFVKVWISSCYADACLLYSVLETSIICVSTTACNMLFIIIMI